MYKINKYVCCEHFMVFLFEICQKAVNDFGIIISRALARSLIPALASKNLHQSRCAHSQKPQPKWFVSSILFFSVLVTRGVYDSCEVFEITITKYIIKSKTRLGL